MGQQRRTHRGDCPECHRQGRPTCSPWRSPAQRDDGPALRPMCRGVDRRPGRVGATGEESSPSVVRLPAVTTADLLGIATAVLAGAGTVVGIVAIRSNTVNRSKDDAYRVKARTGPPIQSLSLDDLDESGNATMVVNATVLIENSGLRPISDIEITLWKSDVALTDVYGVGVIPLVPPDDGRMWTYRLTDPKLQPIGEPSFAWSDAYGLRWERTNEGAVRRVGKQRRRPAG
jgi:hypothetical protein